MEEKTVMRVLSVFGTRPEAIKMCPLVKELEAYDEIDSIVCITAQHRQMLDQVMDVFGIKAKYDLDIMGKSQTLFDITSKVLTGLKDVIEDSKPDIVLVHGDTSTSFVAALAAFYCKIPVGHVEAGLRTNDKYSPFPEEMNRTLTGDIAELHFSPTEQNKENLLRENISKNIFITGNTVIDAFKTTVRENYRFENETLRQLPFGEKRFVLMTAHRRENLGQPIENICHAVLELAQDYSDLHFVYPVHLNPAVREPVFRLLGNQDNISLIDPISVTDMHNIMARSFLVMTDSGGLQEEAPYFGIPVLVLRTETERPEAVEMGTVRVIGVKKDDIVRAANNLIENPTEYDKMAKAVNPYGDGHASERIVQAILDWAKEKK